MWFLNIPTTSFLEVLLAGLRCFRVCDQSIALQTLYLRFKTSRPWCVPQGAGGYCGSGLHAGTLVGEPSVVADVRGWTSAVLLRCSVLQSAESTRTASSYSSSRGARQEPREPQEQSCLDLDTHDIGRLTNTNNMHPQEQQRLRY